MCAVILTVCIACPFNVRFVEPFLSCGVTSGSSTFRSVRHQLVPSPRTHLHLDHPGTHLAASWYDLVYIFKNAEKIGFDTLFFHSHKGCRVSWFAVELTGQENSPLFVFILHSCNSSMRTLLAIDSNQIPPVLSFPVWLCFVNNNHLHPPDKCRNEQYIDFSWQRL